MAIATRLSCQSLVHARRIGSFARRTATTLSAQSSAPSQTPSSLPPLNNIEASWKSLAPGEQEAIFKHLEELQKKDWKELTVDEKKAAYYVAFGPHGPREPLVPAGSNITIALYTVLACVAGVGLFAGVRHFAPKPGPTITPEWQEATRERLREQNSNPFSGVSSDAAKAKNSH